jgi:preprotein translocase subunit Sec61beta
MDNTHLSQEGSHSMKKYKVALILIAIVSVGAITGAALANSESIFQLTWWTADSGESAAQGGDFNLMGTIDQAEVGESMLGGNFKLSGGFWGGGISSQTAIFLPMVLADYHPPNTISTIDSNGDVGQYPSIAIGADNLGLISYYDATNGDLKIAHCDDIDCNSATISTLDVDGDVGQYSSLSIGADGLGLISYYDATNGDLKVAHCMDAKCKGAEISALDTTGYVGGFTSLAIGQDGLGLLSYYDATNKKLKVAHCKNAICTTGLLTTLDSQEYGSYSSIVIGMDGLGLISYDLFRDNLRVAHCKNLTCSNATLSLPIANQYVNIYPSIAMGTDGLGLISYSYNGWLD